MTPPSPIETGPAALAVPRTSREVARLLEAGGPPRAKDGAILFLFRDMTGEVVEVRLSHGLVGHRSPPDFAAVGDGCFALRFEVGPVNRVEYRFELVDMDGTDTLIPDPSNPLRVEDPFGTRSVSLGPGYAEPVWTAPVENPGEVRPIAIPAVGGGTGEALLWRTPGLDEDEPAPLLLFLDGPDYLARASIREILINLHRAGRVPRVRAAFIRADRRDDTFSAHPELPHVLANGVAAVLADQIPMPPSPSDRIGIGASLGGLALLHAHCTRPGFFGGLLLQSGSFFQARTDGMESCFKYFGRISSFVGSVLHPRDDLPPIPIHATCGLGGENLANNRRVVDALGEVGFEVTFATVADAHNFTAWRNCIAPGLARLLEPAPSTEVHP